MSITSSTATASGHASSIRNAATSLDAELTAIAASQSNTPETDLVNAYASICSAIKALGCALAQDTQQITAIAEALSAADQRAAEGLMK